MASVYQVSVRVPNIKGEQTNIAQETANTNDQNDSWQEYKNSRSRIGDITELEDGQYQAKIYSEPVQYLDKDGNWKDINTNIKAVDLGGRIAAASVASGKKNKPLTITEAPYTVDFSTDAREPLILKDDEGAITTSFLDANNVSGVINGSTIVYEGLYPKVDLKRNFNGDGVKQDLILKEAGHPYVFREKLETDYDVSLQPDNSINYYKDGQLVAYTPPIYLEDRLRRRVDLEVSYKDKILTIKLDSTKRIAYPAVIDPTLTPNPTATAGLTGTGGTLPSAVSFLYAGNRYYDTDGKGTMGNEVHRSIIRFDTSVIGADATVTDADLYLCYRSAGYGSSMTTVYRNGGTAAYTDSNVPTLGTITPGSLNTCYTWAAGNIADLSYINKTGTTSFSLRGVETAGTVSATGWGNQNDGIYKPYMVITYNRPVPGAPTNPGGTALSTTSIRWTWTDATPYEDGYRVHAGLRDTAEPPAHTVVCTNATPNSTTCDEAIAGGTINTAYTRHIHAYNAESGDSVASSNVTRFTAANVPGDPTATTVSASSINVVINPNSNPAGTQFQIQETVSGQYVNKTTGALQVAEDWGTYAEFGSGGGINLTGLTANKSYSFKVRARNGDNVVTAYNTNAAVKYTMPVAPNVTPTSATWSNIANVVFTNAAGFGEGGAVYKYVWDQNPTWDGVGGTDWNTGTLTRTMLSGPNYLHVKSYSTGGVNPLTPAVSYGPFQYDNTGPISTTLSWGTIGGTAITITAADAADSQSGLRGDALSYYIERDNNATTFVTADANSGWITGEWTQSGLSGNTAYAYRVKARDSLGNESAWVTPTPAHKYTKTNAPTLNSYVSPTNDNTPQISSTTVDATLANRTVRLYEGANLMAVTTAAADGTFTFSNADWGSSSLSGDTTYTNIVARALNSDAPAIESESSTALNSPGGLLVDTSDPTAPTTRTAAKVGYDTGADVDDAAWNGHNNGNTLYFAWSGAGDPGGNPSGIKRYWVYFGPLAGAVPRTDGQATGDATANATKTLSSPVSGTDYYLRIQTEDNAGNISSDGSIPTLFVYKFDNTPPTDIATLSVNPSGFSSVDSFNFTWTAASDTHSGLKQYTYIRRTTESMSEWEPLDWSGRFVNPAATSLDNITAVYSGVNTFKLVAIDNAGNIGNDAEKNYLYSEPVSGPDNVEVDYSQSQGRKVNMLRFYWDAFPNALGYYYSVNAAPTTQNSTFVDTNSTGFKQFQGVINAQNNIFYVVTMDEFGDIGWGDPSQTSFQIDTVAPGIPTALSITDSSSRESSRWQLTISWDEPDDTTPDFDGYVIERSTDGVVFSALDTITKRQDNTIPNGYLDTNLDNETTYYYRVRSHDNTGNTSGPSTIVSRMPTGKFTTPPTYTSVPSADPRATAVTVKWTTNRPSNSIVQYGPTTAYGQEVSKSTEAVTDHVIEVLGLTPGATYHFRVQSLDAERDYDPSNAFSGDYTFTTSQAPGISNVTTSEVRLTSAIITWQTTSSATSRILYGPTTSYGSVYTDNSASQTTTHTVKLDGLKDSTTYHYRIQGIDIEGNILTSDDYVFETLTFPRLSNLELKQVPTATTSTVEVTFNSNVPTTSLVAFSGADSKSAANYDLATEHKIVVSGLRDNTSYTVSAKGRDQYGNEASPLSASFKTDFDTRPPAVSSVTTETEVAGYGVDAKGQIIVSWETDEPATSQIEYGIGSTGDYTNKTQEDSTLSTTHVVIISDLKPSSPYHFRVISKDSADNTVESVGYTALTPQANRSIFDAILTSLNKAIGWMFRR